jgi:hypothetical protein
MALSVQGPDTFCENPNQSRTAAVRPRPNVRVGSRAAIPTTLAARPVYPRQETTYCTAASRRRRAKGLCAPASNLNDGCKAVRSDNPSNLCGEALAAARSTCIVSLIRIKSQPRTTGETMGSNGVVSIRVEALGVSITIVDGNIAIEQTSTGKPIASPAGHPASARQISARPARPATEHAPPVPDEDVSAAARENSDAGSAGIDEVEQTPHQSSPAGSNGAIERDSVEEQENRWAPALTGPSRDSGTAVPTSQTKPLWSDEEVQKLRALYPTHSASAIATQLGRGRNSVRSKAQNLGLRKDAPPTVTSKPATARPRSLSAAATADPVLTALPGLPAVPDEAAAGFPIPHGGPFSAVPLLDHHPGQCRWIVSDVWPVMYCGTPVVDSSSWCEQHSRRVFNARLQSHGARLYRLSKIFR